MDALLNSQRLSDPCCWWLKGLSQRRFLTRLWCICGAQAQQAWSQALQHEAHALGTCLLI